MRVVLSLTLAALLLAGCGVKRPLMRPSEIPAYQEKRERKRQQVKQESQLPTDPLIQQLPPEEVE